LDLEINCDFYFDHGYHTQNHCRFGYDSGYDFAKESEIVTRIQHENPIVIENRNGSESKNQSESVSESRFYCARIENAIESPKSSGCEILNHF